MPTYLKMNDSLIKSLKDYWFILAFVVSLVVTWTQFDSRIKTLEVSSAKQEIRTDAINTNLIALQTNIAEIKTTLDFIKNNISK